MNLLQSDVLNARSALRGIGIDPGKVWTGWHNGNISVIITCPMGRKREVLKVLEEETSISIPIIVEEDFIPKW